MSAELLSLKSAGTAAIADVFDTLGIEPPVFDNSLQPAGDGIPFAGPAYTVAGESRRFVGGDPEKLQAIDSMTDGVVAVWAGKDVHGVCCFGDLLATAMRARGCAAAVVDGGVRDVQFLREFGMPVLARYRTPAQGIGRWKVTGSQIPVQVRGALREWLTISPGDLVVGDADGVIAIPANLVAEVTARVTRLSETESSARAEIAAGLSLTAALAKYGHL